MVELSSCVQTQLCFELIAKSTMLTCSQKCQKNWRNLFRNQSTGRINMVMLMQILIWLWQSQMQHLHLVHQSLANSIVYSLRRHISYVRHFLTLQYK